MAEGERKEGDALKMFTVVMGLLCVVMAVLYFVIDHTRKEYEQANVQVEKWMTGQGNTASPLAERPQSYPDLALAVERLSKVFNSATGSTGLDRTISQQIMENAATHAGLRIKYTAPERTDKNSLRRYETVTARFDFQDQSGEDVMPLWKVLDLLWAIEYSSRYRVSELIWYAADAKENPTAPFDLVKRVSVEVALRGPIVSD